MPPRPPPAAPARSTHSATAARSDSGASSTLKRASSPTSKKSNKKAKTTKAQPAAEDEEEEPLPPPKAKKATKGKKARKTAADKDREEDMLSDTDHVTLYLHSVAPPPCVFSKPKPATTSACQRRPTQQEEKSDSQSGGDAGPDNQSGDGDDEIVPDDDAGKSEVGSRMPSGISDDSDGMDGDSGVNQPPAEDAEEPPQDGNFVFRMVGFSINLFSDVPMQSPPPTHVDLEGASRVEGGTSRGHAQGNVYNMADFALHSNPAETAWGKVRVFLQPTFQTLDPKTTTNSFVAKIRAYSTLGPLLVDLAKKNDSISSDNCNIYIFEDEDWVIKGRYLANVESTEPIEWTQTETGLFLYVIGVSHPPASQLGSNTTSLHPSDSRSNALGTSSALPGLPSGVLLTPEEKLRVQLLEVPAHLVSHIKAPPLQLAYAKFKAVTAASHKLNGLVAGGQWTGPKTTLKEIISLCAAPSTWYESYAGPFIRAQEFTPMITWLESDGSNIEVTRDLWGRVQPKFGFNDLKEWLDEAEKEVEKRRKEKGKEKQKDGDQEPRKHRRNIIGVVFYYRKP
ncbi:hypothetical protein BDN72DRAFT_866040 [Pluteus cervinus]|uniref:Uncharacterized protein n=1 Tax=Pluteus cervinus TaxID=181527 RepID=A0ACD3A098_9AGAR|nr:hypothetical protein BDN72DRAFT_866040 [Pluteus cervinus]